MSNYIYIYIYIYVLCIVLAQPDELGGRVHGARHEAHLLRVQDEHARQEACQIVMFCYVMLCCVISYDIML